MPLTDSRFHWLTGKLGVKTVSYTLILEMETSESDILVKMHWK